MIRRSKICPEPSHPLDQDVPYSIYQTKDPNVNEAGYPKYEKTDQERFVRHVLWEKRKDG